MVRASTLEPVGPGPQHARHPGCASTARSLAAARHLAAQHATPGRTFCEQQWPVCVHPGLATTRSAPVDRAGRRCGGPRSHRIGCFLRAQGVRVELLLLLLELEAMGDALDVRAPTLGMLFFRLQRG